MSSYDTSLGNLLLDKVISQMPISETTYYILLSLADEPRHGYAILQDVEALSQGRVQLGTGTLYGAIKRLLEQGWIERVDVKVSDGRGRKDYRLTPTGRLLLDAEVQRLRSALSAAQQRLQGGPA
jgi:DNA-binding PadR family transcriptional regulator